MVKLETQESPITHATVSLHRSNLQPDKVDLTLKLTVTEVRIINKTINEAELNPFLAKYGLSPIELTALGKNSHRQITEVIEFPEVPEAEKGKSKEGEKVRS